MKTTKVHRDMGNVDPSEQLSNQCQSYHRNGCHLCFIEIVDCNVQQELHHCTHNNNIYGLQVWSVFIAKMVITEQFQARCSP